MSSATRVSIRLLGPMMMQDSKHPLFVDFMPHFQKLHAKSEEDVKRAVKSLIISNTPKHQ
ncbi:DUF3861 family protein [Vibrio lentus]|nr:DUF3861 family protein [Vibrio lentus]